MRPVETTNDPTIEVSDVAKAFKMTVVEAIAKAASEVGAVGKNARMDSGPARYAYRSLDDLMDAVHEPLCNNGVVFVPHQIEVIDKFEKTTRSGSVQYAMRAIVTYRIYGPQGDYVDATVLGEATDTGDKLTNKLMSGAFKYALAQTLSLPYSMDDQDATLSEPVVAEAPAKRATPKAKAPSTDTFARLEELAGRLGKTTEQITGKFRQTNGNLTMEQFQALPPDRVQPLVEQIEKFLNTQ